MVPPGARSKATARQSRRADVDPTPLLPSPSGASSGSCAADRSGPRRRWFNKSALLRMARNHRNRKAPAAYPPAASAKRLVAICRRLPHALSEADNLPISVISRHLKAISLLGQGGANSVGRIPGRPASLGRGRRPPPDGPGSSGPARRARVCRRFGDSVR